MLSEQNVDVVEPLNVHLDAPKYIEVHLIVPKLAVTRRNGSLVAQDLGGVVVLNIGEGLLVVLVTLTEEVVHVVDHLHR